MWSQFRDINLLGVTYITKFKHQRASYLNGVKPVFNKTAFYIILVRPMLLSLVNTIYRETRSFMKA